MKTILLIEDNDDIRENTAEILELAGYAVETAENGKVGVEKAQQQTPDLVICDIMMPVLDGYGVLRIFSGHDQLSTVPFIFLTAKTERTDFRKGMELGADDYLTKPFDESELLSAVESRLARFAHLRADYDLKQEGLEPFLTDAQRVGGLDGLTTDRKPRPVKKKQYLYAEGDEPTRVFFLKSGQVKTVKSTPDGKELITSLYGPGEFVGFLDLLLGQDHRDSAVVLDDAEVVYIPKDDFMELLLRNQEVGRQFVKLLAGRVAEREEQLLGMAYNSIRRRVADVLVAHADQHPNELLSFSRDNLAAMVGTAKESLIRTLSEFREDGYVEMEGTAIRVVKPEKLRRGRW